MSSRNTSPHPSSDGLDPRRLEYERALAHRRRLEDAADDDAIIALRVRQLERRRRYLARWEYLTQRPVILTRRLTRRGRR